MMRSFLKKLKSKAGESLVESMAAILIFTMASIVLYTMVTTAGDINAKAKAMDQKNQTELVAVERGEKTYVNAANETVTVYNGVGNVTFSIVTKPGSTKQIASVPVDIYGGQNNSLYAYYVQPKVQPGGGT